MKLSKRSFLHSLAIWWHLRVLKPPLMISFSIHFHNTNNVIKSKLSEICLQAESVPSCPTSLNTWAREASGQRAGPLAAIESARRRLNGALRPHLPRLWKPFAICTVKASFLPSFNWPHQKQKPRNENDYTLSRPRSLPGRVPSQPLQRRRREPPKAPPPRVSTSRRSLSALRCNSKTRTHSRLPD